VALAAEENDERAALPFAPLNSVPIVVEFPQQVREACVQFRFRLVLCVGRSFDRVGSFSAKCAVDRLLFVADLLMTRSNNERLGPRKAAV
jgi:hypothetical protein